MRHRKVSKPSMHFTIFSIDDLTRLIGVAPFDYTLHGESVGFEWENG